MTLPRITGKDAALRVQNDFHRRPRPFRFEMWFLAAAACLVAGGWVGFEVTFGEPKHFAGGPLARCHRSFENRCSECHRPDWAPIKRLVGLSPSIASIDNQKCIRCHQAPGHHEDRIDHFSGILCSECHHEHQGDQDLRGIADDHCLRCHRTLDSVTAGKSSFASHIKDFTLNGHPSFLVHRLAASAGSPPPASALETGGPQDRHKAYDVVAYIGRAPNDLPDDSSRNRHWQDKAAIRFNHSAHLKDLMQPDGRREDWSQKCYRCHEYESDGGLMKRIRYERHCKSCHPNYFDADQKAVVPHERPEIVHGWLTDYYTLQALKGKKVEPDPKPLKRDAFPGRPVLSTSEARTVDDWVRIAESTAVKNTVKLCNRPGGCSYCHAFEAAKSWGRLPEIKATRIPRQWLGNSRFNHQSHQMLQCWECHKVSATGEEIYKSQSTGDVLIPKIESCYQCHSSKPERPVDAAIPKDFTQAANRCVDCHTYHDKTVPRPVGSRSVASFLNPDTRGAAGR